MCMYVSFKYRICLGNYVSFIKSIKSNRNDCESFRVRVVCVYVSLICVWLECVCVSFKYSFKKSCVLVRFRVLIGVRSRFMVRELCVIGVSRG